MLSLVWLHLQSSLTRRRTLWTKVLSFLAQSLKDNKISLRFEIS